jgi:hypothetical protein
VQSVSCECHPVPHGSRRLSLLVARSIVMHVAGCPEGQVHEKGRAWNRCSQRADARVESPTSRRDFLHKMFCGSIRGKKLGASFTEIGQDPIEILALAVAALNARK